MLEHWSRALSGGLLAEPTSSWGIAVTSMVASTLMFVSSRIRSLTALRKLHALTYSRKRRTMRRECQRPSARAGRSVPCLQLSTALTRCSEPSYCLPRTLIHQTWLVWANLTNMVCLGSIVAQKPTTLPETHRCLVIRVPIWPSSLNSHQRKTPTFVKTRKVNSIRRRLRPCRWRIISRQTWHGRALTLAAEARKMTSSRAIKSHWGSRLICSRKFTTPTSI